MILNVKNKQMCPWSGIKTMRLIYAWLVSAVYALYVKHAENRADVSCMTGEE
jgi:hypothetical protein